MPGCVRWTVLFVSCWAAHVAGQLHEPLNVKIESRNFSLFLTWLPAPKNPSSVTYEVQYTNYSDDNEGTDKFIWTPVPACENISITECDFTCVLMHSWDWSHEIKVRTIYPSNSSWVEIQDIEYMFTVDPAPPNLTVTQGEGSITIKAFTQKPLCVPEIIFLRSLSYIVVIRRKYDSKEIVLEQEMDGPSITLKTLGYNGEYCVAAKTKSISDTIKESKFSNPQCYNITNKDGYDHIMFILPVFLICAGGFIAFVYICIWYKITVKSKKPEALDFSNNKYCQKNLRLPELYSEFYHSVTIYHIAEQDSSTKFLHPNKFDDGVNVYPVSGQGYMERPTMQTSDSHSQKYFSSKSLTFNSSSDKSSTDCSCPNTCGSVTSSVKNDQTNDCPKGNNIDVSGAVQMLSLTSMSVSNSFDSLSILDQNSLVNVPLNTLLVEDINEQMDNSDGESGNECFTDSEDLDSLSTDYKMSDSKSSSQDKKANKNCSGYKQRTYMSRR